MQKSHRKLYVKPIKALVMWELVLTMTHTHSYLLKKPLGDCCELKLHLGGHAATAFGWTCSNCPSSSKGRYLLRHTRMRRAEICLNFYFPNHHHHIALYAPPYHMVRYVYHNIWHIKDINTQIRSLTHIE